jgi:hypothetical protein
MKILILTQKLWSNYGGILQAYALQVILKRNGHEAVTNNQLGKISFWEKRLGSIIIFFSQYGLRKTLKQLFKIKPSPQFWRLTAKNTLNFVIKNINTADFFKEKKRPNKKDIKCFDAIIVGSDQVWRLEYSDLPVHLLNFTQGMNIKRIAYAASFGVDNHTEFQSKFISKQAKSAKQFDAISVREKSGISLCEKFWNVQATQTLDPTLLLEKEDYIELIEKEDNIVKSTGNLLVYILDRTHEKQQIIDKTASHLMLEPFEIYPGRLDSIKEIANIEQYILPPVSQWLRSFTDAEFVITDSFHGCVFSIIFNKPFIAIGNEDRGMARFKSLLEMFNLESRLLLSPTQLSTHLMESSIDWDSVNRIRKEKKIQSIQFLRNNLEMKGSKQMI